MGRKFIKVLLIVVCLFLIYFFVNNSKALEVYNYKGKNYIMGVKPGSTVRNVMGEKLGTYENLKKFGINPSENAKPALIQNIYKKFIHSTGVAYKGPDEKIQTNDKYTDENGKEYFFILKGDVNLDGKVNAIDLILIKRWLLGLEVNLEETTLNVELNNTDSEEEKLFMKVADLNNDGYVKSNDLMILKQYLISESLDKSEVDGDLNFDGVCDIFDYQIMLDIKNGKFELDKSQEENSHYFDNMSIEQLEGYINKENMIKSLFSNKKPLTQNNN